MSGPGAAPVTGPSGPAPATGPSAQGAPGPERPQPDHGTDALRLVMVTDPELCRRRGVVATAAAAVAGGATMVQLRDPHAPGRTLYELAAALLDALDGTGVPLVVNDRPDVALAVGAAGVHLGQADLPVPPVRALAGPAFLIGLSVSRPDELAEVRTWPAGTVDYLGVGPVHPTGTKPDAAAPLGLGGLRAVADASPVPCVAIGGIDEERAAAALSHGAVGVAVVSAICAADDPEAAARRLRHRLGAPGSP